MARTRVKKLHSCKQVGSGEFIYEACSYTKKESLKEGGELRRYRNDALRAASELGYPNNVILAIKNATTSSQVERAMRYGRTKYL